MHRRVALIPAVALAVAGALVSPSGPAQASAWNGLDPRPVGWSATDSWSQRRTVSNYWTSQRMLAAQPLSVPRPRRTAQSAPSRGNPWAVRGASFTRQSQGTAWSARPTKPSTSLQAVVPNSPGLRWTDGGAVVRTAGRVFFTTAEGGNASCSGTAVTSANESVVITAGHCVKLNGASHRNWVFVPGFDNGQRPFGTWVATRLLTTQQWNANEDINFDIAAAVVAPLQGRTLTDVVGGQGVAFNQPRRAQMFSFGYPAAEPFDGSRLIYCSGQTFDDTLMSRDLGLRCNMTGGSSGGPWFQGFDESTGMGWVNSVNSFKYDQDQRFMFGPFFGNDAMAVFRAAQNADAA
ncbi:trypsin-like serine peptidase [Nonomuraea purpurea]|uniref:Trypsin-like serine peptidase n=1 Tax=Nonomuraea purpurea TaxID=1849276 RepID=A0ABV8GBZ8_9ACTN